MSESTYPIQVVRGVPVIGAPAVLDSCSARVLRTTLLRLIVAGHATAVIDMSVTAMCDAAGRTELGRAYQLAAAEGGDLRLVGGTALTEILGDTGLGLVVPQYPSVTAAVAETPAVRIVPFRAVGQDRVAGRRSARPSLAVTLPAR